MADVQHTPATLTAYCRMPSTRGIATVIVLLLAFVAFWALRIGYWSHTIEAPFSDIADYIVVARQIASNFTFGLPPDRMAYWTPATPTAIAIAIWIAGDHFEAVYRVMIQLAACAAGLLLAFELGKATRKPLLGAVFFLIVALSRPSIFWSYKLSTEGLTEALLMATTAFALQAVRNRRICSAAVAGAFAILCGLNRPQYVVPALMLPALIPACAWWLSRKADPATRCRTAIRLFVATAIGITVAWSPWIIRNYNLFGALVPLSTTGYESFLWDSGAGSIKPGVAYTELRLSDGEVLREFGMPALQRIVLRYPKEIDRRDFYGRVAAAWLRENAAYYPGLVTRRLWLFVNLNGATGLTKVSREVLFGRPSPDLGGTKVRFGLPDRILLDKRPWIVGLALFGIAVGLLASPAMMLLLGALWATPWFTAALVIGAERAVEPLIPATIWLALYGIVETAWRVGVMLWNPPRGPHPTAPAG